MGKRKRKGVLCQAPKFPEQAGEITIIPTKGGEAWIGAAMYLAILAYPGQDERELTRRDRFLEACESFIRTRKDRTGVIQKVFYRIQSRRLPAAAMARWIWLVDFCCQARGQPGYVVSENLRVPKVRAMAREHIRVHQMLKKEQPNHLLRYFKEGCPSVTSVVNRVWSQSKSVLHLSSAFVECAIIPTPNRSFYGHLLNPEWVPRAVSSSEAWRRRFAELFPQDQYDPSVAIRIIPAKQTRKPK